MKNIVPFFQNLSERLRSENDLSDVTWAMCQTSDQFMRVFLKFIFDENEIDFNSPITDFQREYGQTTGYRPDFYFKNNEKEFLIEVKIYDQWHHFDYLEGFPNAILGYIVNYKMESQNGITVKAWEDFYNHLAVVNWDDKDDEILIQGYGEYLKSVCNIIKIEKMELHNLNALYHFNLAIKQAFPILGDKYQSDLYLKISGVGTYYSGIYYKFCYGESQQNVWGWFGVYYETSTICLELNNAVGFGKPIFDVLLTKYKAFVPSGKIKELNLDSNKFVFTLNKSEFDGLSTGGEQTDYIRSFLKQVFDFLATINNQSNEP